MCAMFMSGVSHSPAETDVLAGLGHDNTSDHSTDGVWEGHIATLMGVVFPYAYIYNANVTVDMSTAVSG